MYSRLVYAEEEAALHPSINFIRNGDVFIQLVKKGLLLIILNKWSRAAVITSFSSSHPL